MLAQHHEDLAQTAPQTAPESSKEKGKLAPIIRYSGRRIHFVLSDLAKVVITDEDKTAKPEPVTASDHRDLAADLMSEIQVETYSSMDNREKTEL